MTAWPFLFAVGLLFSAAALAAELPKTHAEQTAYKETSRYADVMEFVAAIQRADPTIRVETFGVTNEKRALPLVIAGPKGVVDPGTARATGLPVVFIMANIHAGEVEGKEAAQMLLRDLLSSHRKLRDKLIVLIAPIYNADGNEPISADHRKTQDGPPGGVGNRENAQGLDLNRDYMKLESPEGRGLVANVFRRWDPLLTVDLHTTNGSYHGYQLTYAPMLNPNADARLIAFERETLLPEIRARMTSVHAKETYYYGNFVDQLHPEQGWYTFDSRPRFGNNYAGLRNRFAILSEAYSYIDFQARVEVTHQFLHEILRAAAKHAGAMKKLAKEADASARTLRTQGHTQGVRFEMKPWREKVPILWERAVAGGGEPDPWTEKGAITRTGKIEPVVMTDFGIFAAKESDDVPFAFAIDPRAEAAVENLRMHGVVIERLSKETPASVDEFRGEATHAEREFQKHRELTFAGSWTAREMTLPPGTFIVRMDQPLARLAFYLLDPRSDDGLFEWNFFDALIENGVAPVRRIRMSRPLPATRMD
jgi:hypothetical protein